MWVFTDVADWYDKQRKDNATWLENVMDKSSYDFLGAAVYTLAGAAWLLNAIPGAIGGGFIDTARLGDGVKEGGWGYGQDALRLLVLAGPALRAARYGLALVAAVDETKGVGNCLWVQSARALRMSGTAHYARVADLALAAGIPVADTGAISTAKMLPFLTQVGADAKAVGTVASFEEVATLARNNPNGLVIFGVRFARAQAGFLVDNGHALIARSVGGTVVIIDRSGKVYGSLKELEVVYRAAGEMGMTIHSSSQVLIVANARFVGFANAVSNASWLANSIGVEMRAIPGPKAPEAAPVVLLTDSQLLAGWWWVWVDQFFWCYCFNPDGSVDWSDPFNHSSGSGQWSPAKNAIEISWNGSTTREKWTLPIMTGQQTGSYVTNDKTTTLKAMKIPGTTWAQLPGKWQVRVSNWTWRYEFSAYGDVIWTDPLNGKGGRGTWSFTKTTVFIKWENSTTKEEWSLPISPPKQGGSSRMSQKVYDLSASKTP